jgi:hypothetical protein
MAARVDYVGPRRRATALCAGAGRAWRRERARRRVPLEHAQVPSGAKGRSVVTLTTIHAPVRARLPRRRRLRRSQRESMADAPVQRPALPRVCRGGRRTGFASPGRLHGLLRRSAARDCRWSASDPVVHGENGEPPAIASRPRTREGFASRRPKPCLKSNKALLSAASRRSEAIHPSASGMSKGTRVKLSPRWTQSSSQTESSLCAPRRRCPRATGARLGCPSSVCMTSQTSLNRGRTQRSSGFGATPGSTTRSASSATRGRAAPRRLAVGDRATCLPYGAVSPHDHLLGGVGPVVRRGPELHASGPQEQAGIPRGRSARKRRRRTAMAPAGGLGRNPYPQAPLSSLRQASQDRERPHATHRGKARCYVARGAISPTTTAAPERATASRQDGSGSPRRVASPRCCKSPGPSRTRRRFPQVLTRR